MKDKLIAVLGLDENASGDQVVNAVQHLVRVSNSPGAKIEKSVREKMAGGLSREDALQVIKDQQVDDEIRAERGGYATAEAFQKPQTMTRKEIANLSATITDLLGKAQAAETVWTEAEAEKSRLIAQREARPDTAVIFSNGQCNDPVIREMLKVVEEKHRAWESAVDLVWKQMRNVHEALDIIVPWHLAQVNAVVKETHPHLTDLEMLEQAFQQIETSHPALRARKEKMRVFSDRRFTSPINCGKHVVAVLDEYLHQNPEPK